MNYQQMVDVLNRQSWLKLQDVTSMFKLETRDNRNAELQMLCEELRNNFETHRHNQDFLSWLQAAVEASASPLPNNMTDPFAGGQQQAATDKGATPGAAATKLQDPHTRVQPPSNSSSRSSSPSRFDMASFADQLAKSMTSSMASSMAAALSSISLPKPSPPAGPKSMYKEFRAEVTRRGLTFEGRKDDHVLYFLNQFEELLKLFKVTDAELKLTLPSVLQGEALRWYGVQKDTLTSWKDIRQAITDTYLPDSWDMKMKKKIMNRTQATGESGCNFVTAILTMNQEMQNKMPEAELVELMITNLNSDHFEKLPQPNPKTLRDLMESCRLTDRFFERRRTHVDPPPELVKDKRFGVFLQESEARPNVMQAHRVPDARTREDGERAGATPKRRIYCYNCGAEGKTVNSCPCRQRRQQGNDRGRPSQS